MNTIAEMQTKIDEQQKELERLRAAIEFAVRYLSANPDGDIDWKRFGAVLQTCIVGHDNRREAAEQEAERLRAALHVFASNTSWDRYERFCWEWDNETIRDPQQFAADAMKGGKP